MSSDSIEQLTSPSQLEGLRDLSLEEVRNRRNACRQAEEALSLRRRLVQGRLDIVQAELYRRSGTASQTEVSGLVAALPDILAERGDRHLGPGRLTVLDSDVARFGDDFEQFEKDLEKILSAGQMSQLDQLEELNLRQIADELDNLERSISGDRHKLHAHIDRFQEEIVRRYKSGEASVDNLLESQE